MAKKNHSNDETTSLKLSNFFKDLFGDGDPFTDLKREYKPISLKKKGDLENEVQWQITNLEKDGHKVLNVAQNRYGESIVVYRLFYGDDLDDEDITLKVKVISKRGVKVPDSAVFLIVDTENKHMRIADIRIQGERVNRGYGSIMMEGLLKLAHQLEIKYITGWISGVDWDHIERLEHFYRKFGFECELNHESKHGTITWVNEELGASREEFDILIGDFKKVDKVTND
ncbi:hypothetical protein [Brevibacillus sp. SAFN-007a]|uniref:hypothetical protein n=1 Tax=Brevibacillus sp. SAFN-007a TaxID=3436862 RepID=UPI003F7D8478